MHRLIFLFRFVAAAPASRAFHPPSKLSCPMDNRGELPCVAVGFGAGTPPGRSLARVSAFSVRRGGMVCDAHILCL